MLRSKLAVLDTEKMKFDPSLVKAKIQILLLIERYEYLEKNWHTSKKRDQTKIAQDLKKLEEIILEFIDDVRFQLSMQI